MFRTAGILSEKESQILKKKISIFYQIPIDFQFIPVIMTKAEKNYSKFHPKV